MPKFAKPWHRRGRGWYVTLDGKQIPLGTDRDSAFVAYHNLMQKPPSVRTIRTDSVAVILDHFLEWLQQHRAAGTFEWYRFPLQLFDDRYPDLKVGELRPFHVQQWVDSFKHLKDSSKRNYC